MFGPETPAVPEGSPRTIQGRFNEAPQRRAVFPGPRGASVFELAAGHFSPGRQQEDYLSFRDFSRLKRT